MEREASSLMLLSRPAAMKSWAGAGGCKMMMALMEGLGLLEEVGRGASEVTSGSFALVLPKKGGCVIHLEEEDHTPMDVETLGCRFMMMEEVAASKNSWRLLYTIGDCALLWVSPTDKFRGSDRVKGGAPNNGISCQSITLLAWNSVSHTPSDRGHRQVCMKVFQSCARCAKVSYCDRNYQKKDWASHKCFCV